MQATTCFPPAAPREEDLEAAGCALIVVHEIFLASASDLYTQASHHVIDLYVTSETHLASASAYIAQKVCMFIVFVSTRRACYSKACGYVYC